MPRKKKTKATETDKPNMTEIKIVAEPFNTDAEKTLELVNKFEITNQTELVFATKAAAEIKDTTTEIEEKRDGWTGKLKKAMDETKTVIDEIEGFFNPAVASLKEAEKTIKARITAYDDSLETKRIELLSQVADAPNQEAKQQLIAEADNCKPGKVSGLVIKKAWKGKATDPSEIVKWAVEKGRLELLLPDEKAINALGDKAREIPGWAVAQGTTIAITPSKVER